MFVLFVNAQTIETKLATAWKTFEEDPQLKSSISSLYVIDANSGNVVFDKNSRIGLAPASTQKIITSAAAYELLGKKFRYETKFLYYSSINKGKLTGGIAVLPSFDPTLGSWRWKSTSENAVLTRTASAISKLGIKEFDRFILDETGMEAEAIPGGWNWDDIGNYYGAGADALNWRENQFDLILKSGANIGDSVRIVGTKPFLYDYSLTSKLRSAAKGTGDNAYIYFSTNDGPGVVRGTIPVNEERFTISGAMPSGKKQFLATLQDSLSKRGIAKKLNDLAVETMPNRFYHSDTMAAFHVEVSPPLDSISYWFLKRSINLYGEALAKTVAFRKGKQATSDNGAEEMQNLWSAKSIGIDKSELNMVDGSGLSPLNRTTTHAQVAILQYAKKQPWFESYYFGFPEYNGMKLKSGTISRVKSFSGYHTAKDGRQYIVSFLVNNYSGSSSSLVQKMYKVLDVLK